MDFAVIDVETANEDLSSICQIGIASFESGNLAECWKTFVDPQDYFSPINISIHGITERCVRGAPTWPEVFSQVETRISNCIAVSHTPFDRSALKRACERFEMLECECIWLDSARVVRRAWPQFARSGYGLANVAKCFGIQYQAHDALEDARCAGLIVLRAILDTGISLEDWIIRSTRPIGPLHAKDRGSLTDEEPNPDGDLYGEVLVFTGALSMPRREAASFAAKVGCQVDHGVTKHTTILVVGDQDIRKLNGHEKSSKHLKAEALVLQGQRIRIIGESDFLQIIAHSTEMVTRHDRGEN